jgi:hypothetical protein
MANSYSLGGDSLLSGLATPSFLAWIPANVNRWLRQRNWSLQPAYSRLSDAFKALEGMGYGNPPTFSPGEANQKLSTSFQGQAAGLDIGILLHAMIQRNVDAFHEINGVETNISPMFTEPTLASGARMPSINTTSLPTMTSVFGNGLYDFPNGVSDLIRLWSFYKDTVFRQRWNQLVANTTRFNEITTLISNLEKLVQDSASRRRVPFLTMWASNLGSEDNPARNLD